MATLTFLSDQGYWPDLLKDVLDNGAFKSPFNVSATKLVLTFGDLSLTIVGTGLKASDARTLSAGTISSFELRGDDGLIFTETDFISKPTRTAFQAVLDHLDGPVNDATFNSLLIPVFFKEGLTATGQDGFDWFRGTAGVDSFAGNGDFNYLEYFYETGSTGVTFKFFAGQVIDSHGNIDTFSNISGAGGTAKDDTFIGSSAIENLFWVGDDGKDRFQGTVGGIEKVSYKWEGGGQGIVVNLKTGTGTDTFGKVDTFINIDEIEGSQQADTITGSDRDNFFVGFDGADKINGGAGWDTVGYRDEADRGGERGVIVNLSSASVTADIGAGDQIVAAGRARDGFGKLDTLTNIEGVEGTNSRDVIYGNDDDNYLDGHDGNDTLVGGDGDDNLRGSRGDDNLYGGDGDDNFKGGVGKDLISGGSGRDRVNYFLETPASTDTSGKHGVIVNLSTSKLTDVSITGVAERDVAAGTAVDATGGIDTLVSIERLETTEFQDHVVGSSGDNEFILGAGADFARGGNGNDYIEGGSSADTLYGDDGDDHLNGGSSSDKLYGGGGNDYFEGGSGSDQIDGGADFDKMSYAEESGSSGILVNLGAGTVRDTFGSTDTLVGIEGIKGTRFVDTFVGGDGKDEFEGLAGKDKFNGGGGSDLLQYQFESDFGGNRGVILNLSSDDVTADFGNGTQTIKAGTGIDAFGSVDTYVSMEDVAATQRGDVIIGSSVRNNVDGFDGDDVIYGLDGEDNLRGGEGNDELYGGEGKDDFKGGVGNDLIDGGAERDRVHYEQETPASGDNSGSHGVIVNLSTASIKADIGEGLKTVAAGKAIDASGGTDTLVNIERLVTTEFDDYLVGSAVENEFDSGAGNDTILAGGGNDWLFGGVGRDTMTGGTGDDEFFMENISNLGKTASTRDVITDFSGSDYINLRLIDADTTTSGDQNFLFKTAQSTTFDGTKGQLIWSQENLSGTANDRTIVMGDVNGDKIADFQIELTGLIALNSGDFVL